MKESLALLKELTEADGVPGFEDAVRDILVRRLKPHGTVERDRTGGFVVTKKGKSPAPRVMIDCHMDEIGFIVQSVTAKGFLRFLNLGGWSGHVLAAQRVRVHGDDRVLDGVIGSTPPHFLPADRRDKALEIKDMFIDIGAGSREEALSWGVRPGVWAVPYSPFTRMENPKLVMVKALDNRIGCALLVEAIAGAKAHPNTLCGAGSAQEEVGLRGTQATAHMIDPDVAIVLECPPADDTPGMGVEDPQGCLGSGVQIRAYDPTMIANPRLVKLVLDTAREEKIPHQLAIRQSGGTNAGRIHLNGRGVPAVVIGVPARYIHSHASVMNMDDYAAARKLILALIARLDRKTVAGLSGA